MTAWAEAALFAAARAEHVERVIRPALDRGAESSATGTSTRRSSTRASPAGSASSACYELNLAVTGGLLPDRTFVLALDAEDARRRQSGKPRPDRARGRRVPAGRRRRLPGAGVALPRPVRRPRRGAGRPSEIAEQIREQRSRRLAEQPEAKRLLDGGARRGPGARLPLPRPARRRQAAARAGVRARAARDDARVRIRISTSSTRSAR